MAREQLIAEGGLLDLDDLGKYESHFAEGDKGIIDLKLRWTPPSDAVDFLEGALRSAGVTLTRGIEITSSSPHLRIHFKKTLAPLAICGIIIASALAIAALMISWGLYRQIPEQIGVWSWQIVLLIALAIAAVVIIVVLVARKGRIRAGRVVVGK